MTDPENVTTPPETPGERAARVSRDMARTAEWVQGVADALQNRSEPVEPVELQGSAEIGALLGLKPNTIKEYRVRYKNTNNPCPKPAFVIGTGKRAVPGWLPEQDAAWQAWDARRTGRWPEPTPEEVAAAKAAEAQRLEAQIAADRERLAQLREARSQD